MNEKELPIETPKEPSIKMRKLSLVFMSLIISIVITYLATNITFYVPYGGISRSPHVYNQVHGFPFQLQSEFLSNTITIILQSIKNPLNPYFLTFLFWFSGSLTFLLLLRHPKRKKLLIFTGVFALLLMLFEINGEDTCLKGYPIYFFSSCGDLATPNNQFWLLAILNYSFWAVFALVGTFVFLNTYKSPHLLVRLFCPPLILTFYSLVFQTSCGASILFPCPPYGRGFPQTFTGERTLVLDDINLRSFFYDYVFWWIAYNFYNLLVWAKQTYRANESSKL
jgi:hypothetical protein